MLSSSQQAGLKVWLFQKHQKDIEHRHATEKSDDIRKTVSFHLGVNVFYSYFNIYYGFLFLLWCRNYWSSVFECGFLFLLWFPIFPAQTFPLLKRCPIKIPRNRVRSCFLKSSTPWRSAICSLRMGFGPFTSGCWRRWLITSSSRSRNWETCTVFFF